MKQLLKKWIKRTPLYGPLRNWAFARAQKRDLMAWERNGRPDPPPHIIKQRAIRSYAERYGLKILVETGTYFGDMVAAMRGHFDRIYSIELDKELCERARRRFSGDETVSVINGDSGIELGNIVGKLEQPALFWLDGHYSAGETARGVKDTPILDELAHISSARCRGSVVIIDDARAFGADPAYPTIEELREFIRAKMPGAKIEIECDSIRITPSEGAG